MKEKKGCYGQSRRVDANIACIINYIHSLSCAPSRFMAFMLTLMLLLFVAQPAKGQAMQLGPQYVTDSAADISFTIYDGSQMPDICVDPNDWAGVKRAANSLCADIESVTDKRPQLLYDTPAQGAIVVGTIGKNKYIDRLIKEKRLDVSGIKDAWESFVVEPIDGNLIIAGSDKRGTIYGIYNLSENIGVSPWYYWADAPIKKAKELYVRNGRYVMPSPKVKYRGIFLNDEAPCLTSWVQNAFGTNYGGHEFYEKVFELILRLRGNYLWPAMWGWAFYADDPENSALADEMGIVIGTSHHEPMARNHQEWARNRGKYGAWDYTTNQETIDGFFREGVRRIADKEDIITIGMRGDGDAPMGGKEGHDHDYKSEDQRIMETLETVIKNQRKIIKEETGKPASSHPQLWALYKEVQKYYEMGLKVPDDVIILLADDNWGNVRKLPGEKERRHPGGWGMYYHVDYVGAPRNSKWLNVTPIQNMWEQLSLTYEYGVDKLWILNVGDLKPMEYPIALFMDIAWDPNQFTSENLMEHPTAFCTQLFGDPFASEAAEILNLYSKYNGRVTPEMLDAQTYSLSSGEWKAVRDDYLTLEAKGLRLYNKLPQEARDAYYQIILYPVQAMANLYDMYYSQAMNRKLFEEGDPECNLWADNVEKAFARDKELSDYYNYDMLGGKWNGMMTQKHIGYTSWNDDFPADAIPSVSRIDSSSDGGYVFQGRDGVVVIEAPHYYQATNAPDSKWTVITDLGRTLGGVTLMPRISSTEGAALEYRMALPLPVDSVDVYVVLKSTLPFARPEGHRFNIGFTKDCVKEVNYNGHLNDQIGNPYSVFYPTVARRIVEQKVTLPVDKGSQEQTLTISPIEPGMVIEKIIVDCGGFQPAYLYGKESPKIKMQ